MSFQKETYYGYKVHALITSEGYIASFEITPASTDDREGLRDLAAHWSNITILADKGYIGKKHGTGNVGKEYLSFCSETFRQ